MKVKDLIKKLEAQGWRVERRGSGHLMCFAPNGKDMVTLSGTASDHRSIKNALAQLKRAGFVA